MILDFAPQRAPYFTTKPFGPIEKTETLPNGCIRVELKMIVNQELQAAILNYGKDVTVVAPKKLRDEIKDVLKKAVSNYK